MRQLHLGCNDLRSLPKCFADFAKLEILHLEKNFVSQETLSNISECPKLKELNLTENSLTKFPEHQGYNTLQLLNLSNNNYSCEGDLKNIPIQAHVILFGNPIRKKGTTIP